MNTTTLNVDDANEVEVVVSGGIDVSQAGQI